MANTLSCLKDLKKISLILDEMKIRSIGFISLRKILWLPKLNDLILFLYENEIDGTSMTGFAESLKLCLNLTRFSMWLGTYQVDDKGLGDLLESLKFSKKIATLWTRYIFKR